MILTAVDAVYVGYGTPDSRPLAQVTADTLRAHHAAGEFAAGSMGPKVEAALHFLDSGGERAVIAQLDDAERALRGEVGTQILAT